MVNKHLPYTYISGSSSFESLSLSIIGSHDIGLRCFVLGKPNCELLELTFTNTRRDFSSLLLSYCDKTPITERSLERIGLFCWDVHVTVQKQGGQGRNSTGTSTETWKNVASQLTYWLLLTLCFALLSNTFIQTGSTCLRNCFDYILSFICLPEYFPFLSKALIVLLVMKPWKHFTKLVLNKS